VRAIPDSSFELTGSELRRSITIPCMADSVLLNPTTGNLDPFPAMSIRVRGQAIAELCRMAGADESLIPQWRRVGRERAATAGRPPFSQPR
jgi:hypothetical protein